MTTILECWADLALGSRTIIGYMCLRVGGPPRIPVTARKIAKIGLGDLSQSSLGTASGGGRISLHMYVCTSVCLHACMHACMNVYMQVRTYICIYIL